MPPSKAPARPLPAAPRMPAERRSAHPRMVARLVFEALQREADRLAFQFGWVDRYRDDVRDSAVLRVLVETLQDQSLRRDFKAVYAGELGRQLAATGSRLSDSRVVADLLADLTAGLGRPGPAAGGPS